MGVPMNIKAPDEELHKAMRGNGVEQKMGRALEMTKPEAISFTAQEGCRGALAFVELSDPSQIPSLTEPWFCTFNAAVDFKVVMTSEDLKKADLPKLAQDWLARRVPGITRSRP